MGKLSVNPQHHADRIVVAEFGAIDLSACTALREAAPAIPPDDTSLQIDMAG